MHTPLKDNEELVLKLAADGWAAGKIGKKFGASKQVTAKFLARRGDLRYQGLLATCQRNQKTYIQSKNGKASQRRRRKRYYLTVKGVLTSRRNGRLRYARHPERCAEQARQFKEKFKFEYGESYSAFHERTGGIVSNKAMQVSLNKKETVIWNGSRSDK